MSFQSPDTEPSMRPVTAYHDGVSAPPRFLFWGVIGLCFLFVVGAIASVLIFRDVLRPSQQQRVLEVAPFMRAFLVPTPVGGTLPTVEPDIANNDAAQALLNMPIAISSPTASPTSAPAEASTLISTETPLPSPTPTLQLEASPTLAPTATPTLAPSQTEAVNPTSQPASQGTTDTSNVNTSAVLPSAARLFGMTHQKQTWNNCGPATITTALSFYSWRNDQRYAEQILKPNREDKNVSPDELVRFVNEQTQVRAIMRIGGTLEVLKSLIANNFPVVIERGIMFEANDWLGHYQALVAYDDGQGIFYAYDSFLGTGSSGEGVTESYQRLDEDWKAFNRTFIVIYMPQQASELQALLGDHWDETRSAELALEQALTEARFNPQDGHAWFNAGSSLVALGRYQEAANAFDQARRFVLPWRMLWYQFGPFIAYYEVGRYEDVLSLAQINLNNAEELEETYFWRGRVYAAQGRTDAAAAEFRRALGYNPNFQAARQALSSLG